MNKDQIKGAVKEAAGKVQEKFGDLIGSNKQRAEGLVKEVAGKLERKVGDAKETMQDARRKP